MKKMKKRSKFAIGALIGAGLGMLFAPRTGKETRKILSEKATVLYNQLKDLDMDELKKNIEEKFNEIKTDLSNLQKEKVADLAKEKGEALRVKAEELTELAKKTGKPLMEDATNAIKGVVLDAAKEVVNRLEAKDKK